jgi:hypothetical protein
MSWDEIESDALTLSPWREDVTTAEADLRRINRFGMPVCEVAECVNAAPNAWAGRFLFENWTVYPSREAAMAAIDAKAVAAGYSL